MGIAAPVSTPAHAMTGSQLYEFCQSPTNSTPDLMCNAYVRGWFEALEWQYTSKMKNGALDICLHNDATIQQLRRTLEQYLHDHPERSGADAWISFGLALRQEFPCHPK